jgi:hypothetical protein
MMTSEKTARPLPLRGVVLGVGRRGVSGRLVLTIRAGVPEHQLAYPLDRMSIQYPGVSTGLMRVPGMVSATVEVQEEEEVGGCLGEGGPRMCRYDVRLSMSCIRSRESSP